MAQIPNVPMVNKAYLGLQGLNLAYASTTSISIAAGQARNSTNINDIVAPSVLTVSLAASGANGIDTGAVSASHLYAVYVIGNSNGNPDSPTTAGLLSLSFSAPALPAGYDMFRRIGAIRVDGSSHVLPFHQRNKGVDRAMWYDANIAVVTGATDATFTAASFAAYVPSITGGLDVILDMSVAPTAAGNSGALRPTGSASVAGLVIVSGAVAAVAQQVQVLAPVSALASLDYLVTGAISLSLQGYMDAL